MDESQTSAGMRRLDEARIAQWVDALVGGHAEPVQAVFASHGARGPQVQWNPTPGVTQLEPLDFILAHVRALAGGQALARASQIDAQNMRPAIGFISLLDVVDGGADFRYRLFGTIPTAITGFDMTGRRLSQHGASLYMVEYFIATYRAMLRRREPIFTIHGPPEAVKTNAWHRVAAPLADDRGTIIRFVSVNVPVGRSGKPIRTAL
jgi:hypothetical protein